MPISRIWLVALLAPNFFGAQVGPAAPSNYKLYVLHNSYDDEQWCAYRDLDTFKAEVQRRRAPEEATLTFTGGALATVNLHSVDETGDWAADETYRLDGKGNPVALTRIIRMRDGDVHESWFIKNGEAVKQPSTQPAQKFEFVPEPPVITDLKVFPFWPLVRDGRRKILSSGMACTAHDEPPKAVGFSLYILRDGEGRWCAFSNRSQWNSQVASRKAVEKGTLGFEDGKLAVADLTYVDRLKHGTVEDVYGLDSGGSIRAVERTVFDDELRHESWSIKNGEAIKTEGGQAGAGVSPAGLPTIQTTVSDFGFWRLIRDRRSEILSEGRACR